MPHGLGRRSTASARRNGRNMVSPPSVHQIAGDLLPVPDGQEIYADGLIATTFLTNGSWDRGDADKEKMVSDMVDDQIDTIGKAFMGLTLGCARCHNHKFDPISQTDYYGMKAVFAGVQHGERSLVSADTEKRKQEAEELRRQIARVAADLDAQEPLAQPNGPANRRRAVNARKNVERFAPVTAKYVRFT